MHDDRCLEFCAALYSTVKFYTAQCCTWGGRVPISSPCLIRLTTICRECWNREDRAYDERGGLAIDISPSSAVEIDIISEASYIRVRTAFYFQLGDYFLALHWILIFHRGLERMVHLQNEKKPSSNTNTSLRDRLHFAASTKQTLLLKKVQNNLKDITAVGGETKFTHTPRLATVLGWWQRVQPRSRRSAEHIPLSSRV